MLQLIERHILMDPKVFLRMKECLGLDVVLKKLLN